MRRIYIALLTVITVLMVISSSSVGALAEFPLLKEGDLLTSVPNATVDSKVNVTDVARIEEGEFSLAWEPIDGASSYAVRILFNINFNDGKGDLNFIYDKEVKTADTSATVTGLLYRKHYTVLVYGLDSEGKDMAVCDRIHIFTYPDDIRGEETDDIVDADNNKDKSLSVKIIVIIFVAVAVTIFALTVFVAVKVLKKPKN